MELHQLRYLRAVLRTGSVTAAAAFEHVAQPSISKQIRLLERELGVPLFHRVGRRVIPTDAALQLADCADRVLDDIGATAAAIAGPDSEVGGSVRVCATETLVNFLLPAALSRLRHEVPAASVRVEMSGTADVVARVVADEVDFGVLPLPLVDSRVEMQHLLLEDILAVLPPNHRWADRERIDLSALIGEPDLLLSMPGMGLRAQVDAAAHALGILVSGPIEIRSQQALLTLVAAGSGITLAPYMSVAGRQDVRAVPIEPPLRREIVWIRRRGRHISAVGTRLIEPGALVRAGHRPGSIRRLVDLLGRPDCRRRSRRAALERSVPARPAIALSRRLKRRYRANPGRANRGPRALGVRPKSQQHDT